MSETVLKFTDCELLKGLVQDLRSKILIRECVSYEWRFKQLKAIRRMISENENEICAAIHQDIGRGGLESELIEISLAISEVEELMRNLKTFMKPRPVKNALSFQPSSVYIKPEPLGIILVITPWNFPFLLAINVLAGAISAGNAVVLKPSEVSPASSSLLEALITKYLDTKYIKVVQGGKDQSQALLQERFDHICYTGSSAIGREVMRCAANHLTPVTLELGGKNPVYVHADAVIASAARCVACGKLTNTGQLCLAPDLIYVHEAVVEKFIIALVAAVQQFYGDPKTSPDYGRIINEAHTKRINSYLEEDHGGQVTTLGGEVNIGERYVPIVIVKDPKDGSKLMSEEIFGPVFVIKTVSGLDETLSLLRQHEKPLAAYLFSSSTSVQKTFEDQVNSGSLAVNDTAIQGVHPNLPFGGVGSSGMGSYRIAKSFDSFSHLKSVFIRPSWFELFPRYPPYQRKSVKLLRAFIEKRVENYLKVALVSVGTMVIAVVAAKVWL